MQRYWRGYHARILINRYLVERAQQILQDHYNSMAIRIQAVWKGYWIRKTQINFLQLRRWLKDVYTKNDETLENMKKYVGIDSIIYNVTDGLFVYRFRQGALEHVENVTEREAMFWILFILFKVIRMNYRYLRQVQFIITFNI